MDILERIDVMLNESTANVWLLVQPDGKVLHKIKGQKNQYEWIYSPFDTPRSTVVSRKTANGVLKQLRSSKDAEVVDAIGREKYLKLHKGPYVGQN